jgi:hypothetical protein
MHFKYRTWNVSAAILLASVDESNQSIGERIVLYLNRPIGQDRTTEIVITGKVACDQYRAFELACNRGGVFFGDYPLATAQGKKTMAAGMGPQTTHNPNLPQTTGTAVKRRGRQPGSHNKAKTTAPAQTQE